MAIFVISFKKKQHHNIVCVYALLVIISLKLFSAGIHVEHLRVFREKLDISAMVR